MIDNRHPQGVTLLLVMLVLSIVASIGVAVTMLIIKQFQQGADVRDALRAQNIADSGLEEILQQIKTARSGSASQFIESLENQFGCESTAGKAVHGGSFCTEDEVPQEAEDFVVFSLAENDVSTVDLFDPEFDPADPGDEITALEITGVTEEATWIEVSWVAWNTHGGEFEFVSSSTKEIFSSSELRDADGKKLIFFKKDGPENTATPRDYNLYHVNNPDASGACGSVIGADLGAELLNCYCTQDAATTTPDASSCFDVAAANPANDISNTPLHYVVRIKSLFGSASELKVRALSDCVLADSCSGGGVSKGIPSRISFKVIGEFDNVQQAVRVSVPWRFALAGLYDYVLLATEELTKTTSVSPGFYSTGTIEAEEGPGGTGVPFTSEALPNTSPDTPFDCQRTGTICSSWDVIQASSYPELISQNARCQEEPHVNASNGATCGLDSTSGRIVYDLSTYDLGPEFQGNQSRYWFNYRVRITSEYEDEHMQIYLCDNDADPNADYSNCKDEIRYLDEDVATNPPNPAVSTADRDGWLTCSDNAIINNEQYVVVTTAGPHAPRLDWFSISTVPLVSDGDCRFSEWNFSRDEYVFEAEDKIVADGVVSDPSLTIADPEYYTGYECFGPVDSANGTGCNTLTTWYGYQRVAYSGSNPNSGTYIRCDVDRGVCEMSQANSGLGNEVGFTRPLEYENTPGVFSSKVAEGDYFVSLTGSLFLNTGSGENDTFFFDIGNFIPMGTPPVPPNPANYTQYSTSYLPSVDTANEFRAIGPYNNGSALKDFNCVLQQKMRVKSGNAASISISDSNSAGRPVLRINSFRLNHSYPQDGSGNNLPYCDFTEG